MAVKSLDEILTALKERFGEDDSDEVITILEDITDTINEKKNDDGEDWKKKYEDNDKEWRKKYKERFTTVRKEDEEENEDGYDEGDEVKKTKTFDELFETKEG